MLKKSFRKRHKSVNVPGDMYPLPFGGGNGLQHGALYRGLN